MTAGYREGALLCPSCGGELEQRSTSLDSVIDICKECEGIWVDWFDGDLQAVVAEGAEGAGDAKRAGRAGERAQRPSRTLRETACPRCRRPLDGESFAGGGPLILRCGECAGAFVPRAAAVELVAFEIKEKPSDQDNGLWDKLLERIRAALRSS